MAVAEVPNPGCVLEVRRRRMLTWAASAASRRPMVRCGGVKFQLNVTAGAAPGGGGGGGLCVGGDWRGPCGGDRRTHEIASLRPYVVVACSPSGKFKPVAPVRFDVWTADTAKRPATERKLLNPPRASW